MNGTAIGVNPSTPDQDAERAVETLEQAMEKRIENHRQELNQMEASLARAPVQIRRMTRSQAEKLGLWF